jgi:hypothetical protein
MRAGGDNEGLGDPATGCHHMNARFDESVRNSVPPSHHVLLDNFEQVTEAMCQLSGNQFLWDPPDDPRSVLNHYLDVLWSVHVCKFDELCRALIGAVNRGEFIVYGLVGRSLIEHAAVLRYYFMNRIKPTVEEAVRTGSVSVQQIGVIVKELDRFLRGGRFNWEAFFSGDFDKLVSDKQEQPPYAQVNVLTCVQKWAKETPRVIDLYDLFCDLVHPNIGSTFLITKQFTNGIGFGGKEGERVGKQIVISTVAGLLGLFPEIERHLNAMLLLQMHIENQSRNPL